MHSLIAYILIVLARSSGEFGSGPDKNLGSNTLICIDGTFMSMENTPMVVKKSLNMVVACEIYIK